MNIYEKLQAMRSELQGMHIKKSGVNRFANFKYYELADILPPINDLQVKYKTCSIINFNNSTASLTILDAEKPEDKVTIESPMCNLEIKGANSVQNLGGTQTYLRRYLYMAMFEIVENDYFDAVQGADKKSDINHSGGSAGKLINNSVNKFSSRDLYQSINIIED